MQRRWIIALFCALCIFLAACNQIENPETEPSVTEEEIVLESQPATEATVPPTELSTEVPTEIPTEVPTEPYVAPPAVRIADGYKTLLDGINFQYIYGDNSHWSRFGMQGNQVLSVESETAFSNLYMIWDTVPGVYWVVWDTGRVECGQNGFLHEYITLPEAVHRITFEFEKEAYRILCDVNLYTEGSVPDDVQIWQPPYETADILVFPTHSDDDTLFFGPLIAYYAIEQECKVQTAFMVEHHGYSERNHERLNGLWEMGLRNYPILGNAPDTAIHDFDAAMRYYEKSNIEQWQVEQIRRFQPLVVVGHDLEGEYGNGGHKVNSHYLVQSIEHAADPDQFPESVQQYGTWETPKLYLHLYTENEIILDVNVPLEKDPAGRTPFEIATAAYAWHVSQHQYGYRVQQNEKRSYDCRPFGLYRSLVGQDATADIMENLDPERWRNTK